MPRVVLSVKEAAPSSNFRLGENTPRNNNPSEEKSADPVFSKVFTPASKSIPLAPLRDVFTDDHGKPLPRARPSQTHERAKSYHEVLSSQPDEGARLTTFASFKDENARTPFKVFSRPPEQNDRAENVFTPKTPSMAFKPFSDPKPSAFTPFKDTTPAFKLFVDNDADPQPIPVTTRTPEAPLPSFANTVIEIEDDDETSEEQEQEEQEFYQDQDQYYEDDSHCEQYEVPLAPEHLPEEYEEGDSYQDVPLGGRFGQFNVMTPITERTFEFTSSTARGTPSDRYPYARKGEVGPLAEHQAAEIAEKLATELREKGSEEYDNDDDEGRAMRPLHLSAAHLPAQTDPEIVIIEERTGSLSLINTLTLNSKFRPSNPCNPFDPAILSSLISRIPADSHYYDLRGQQSNKLHELERFTKKSRKTSSGSNNTGVLDCSAFTLVLRGHKFNVTEKLGEGGFGSVFKARDVGVQMGDDDDDEDSDDGDEDEELSSMVALKVVKPPNIWEYLVLRRLHFSLPPSLRRSVVIPRALYAFDDESYLVLDLCPQGMLLNIINNAVSAGVSQAGACLDELLVMFFSIELLRLVEAIHNAGFIHGDLKIDNCLLRLEDVPGGATAWSSRYQPSGEGGWSYKGLKVIDFGRTIDTKLFSPNQQFIADWATDDRDCFEVRENRPWTYQTDYFGLAGIVYCMLFGKYIQASSVVAHMHDGIKKYKIATPFKRYWQTDIWNRLFDILLNPCSVKPAGELPVCDALGELRKEMEQWLQGNCDRTSNTLKGLLKKVEMSCY
jgi:checkpoint serine/threonine-protein kinase